MIAASRLGSVMRRCCCQPRQQRQLLSSLRVAATEWQPSGWAPAGAAGGANAPTQPSFETYERDLFARVASIAGLDIARDIIEGKGLREWEARERAETAINAVVHLAECYIPGHTEFGAQQVRETIREDTAAALRSLQQRMNHTGVLRSLQQRMKQT